MRSRLPSRRPAFPVAPSRIQLLVVERATSTSQGVQMANIGAEIEQLSALQSNFNSHASAVDDLTAALTGQLQGTVWNGPAADRFRASWEGEFAPTLRKLSAALVDAGVEVARRRDALVQAG